ncbi:MAG TPA: GntR family transcriptional regulator [Blastocatellia bacterium]|nr:GntR family transcriptional regulator [Blastocatellia bacterium]
MQFLLDKNHKSTLFEQAREQLITALHMGKLRAGDRLPSVRQMSQRGGINLKTAFSIYQRLKEEGYIEIRVGSGAYVADIDGADLDQAYCLSIFQLIKSNLSAASHLKLEPSQYYKLVEGFVEKSRLASIQVTVVECSEEQVNLFAYEIRNRLNARVFPVLLDQLERPDRRVARTLARTDYFATTDYHFKQVKEMAARYEKKILQLRLNAAFLPELIAAARVGRVLMVVSNTSFFPAFRQNLTNLGISPAILDRITAVDGANLAEIRAALARTKSIYVSPICDQRIRNLVPARVKELRLDSMLSNDSIEALEAVMLFHIPPTATR